MRQDIVGMSEEVSLSVFQSTVQKLAGEIVTKHPDAVLIVVPNLFLPIKIFICLLTRGGANETIWYERWNRINR